MPRRPHAAFPSPRRRAARSVLRGLAGCGLAVWGCAAEPTPAPPPAAPPAPQIEAEGPAAEVAARTQKTLLEVWRTIHDLQLPPAPKRERVEALVAGLLDKPALSRAALGPLAQRFSPAQLDAFYTAYSRYVTSWVVARMARHPQHPVEIERASYDAERGVVRLYGRGSATLAGIPGVRRLAPRERIRLELTLREREGAWRVAALKMNDVDVSANFRDQFRSLLSRSDPDALIAELQQRNEHYAASNPFDTQP